MCYTHTLPRLVPRPILDVRWQIRGSMDPTTFDSTDARPDGTQSSDWKQQCPDAYGALLGNATVAELGNDQQKLSRTWQALAEIYSKSSQGQGIASDKQIAADVQNIIQNGQEFDPATFGQMAAIMSGTDPNLVIDRDQFAHGFGVALQTLGTFVGALSPPAGVAVNVAGIWAEDALKYLGQPGLNLSVSFVPPTDPDNLSIVNQLAFSKLAEQCSSATGNNFSVLLSDSVIKQQLGVDFDADPQALAQSLPEELQQAITPVAGDSSEDLESGQAVIASFMQVINSRFDTIDQQYSSLVTSLQQSGGQTSQQAVQAASSSLSSTYSEASGAIAFGSLLLGAFSGNQQLANTFQTVLSSGLKVYYAAAQLAMGLAGPFALLGSVAGAYGSIAQLFSSSPNIYALLKQDLDALSTKIDSLSTHIDVALSGIQQTETAILNKLNQLYALVLAGDQQAAVDFASLQHQLQNLDNLLMAADRQTAATDFDTNLENCRRLFATAPPPDFSNVALAQEYRQYLTDFYEYAASISHHTAFTGDYTISPGPGNYDALTAQVEGRQHLELLCGLIPAFCELLDVPLNLPPAISTDPADQVLPNFVEWSKGVQAYLECRLLTTAVESDLTQEDLTNMLADGVRLRTAAITISGEAAVDACSQLMVQTQPVNGFGANPKFFGIISNSLKFDQWAQFNLSQFDYQMVSPDAVASPTYTGQRLYADNTIGSGKPGEGYYFFDSEDPLEIARQNGWIVFSAPTAPNRQQGYTQTGWVVSIPELSSSGPSGQGSYEYSEAVYDDNHRVEVEIWGRDQLLSDCVYLYRKHVEYPAKQAGFSTWLQSELGQPNDDLAKFEAVGAASKIAVTMGYVCNFLSDDAYLTDLTALPIISSRQDTIDAIVEWVSSEDFLSSGVAPGIYTQFDDYRKAANLVMNVLSPGLIARIDQAQMVLVKSMAYTPTPRGPYCVDETLRRLGGYMIIRGIPINLPKLPVS